MLLSPRVLPANTQGLLEETRGERKGDIIGQVEKDAELIASGKVSEITWVFWRSPNTDKVGATDDLLRELKAAGIKTEIAGDLPKDIVEKAVKKYGATPK